MLFLLLLLRCRVAEPWTTCARPIPHPPLLPYPALQVGSNQLRLSLAVGDTCYSTVQWLNVRGQPYLTARRHAQFSPAQPLTILDLPNSQWAHVSYMNQDVGITGYVNQRYLTKQRPKASGGSLRSF